MLGLASKFSFVSVVLFLATIGLQLVTHKLLLSPHPALTPAVAAMVWPWTSALAMGAVMASQMTGRLKRCSRPYRVFLSVIATIDCVLYLWPSPGEGMPSLHSRLTCMLPSADGWIAGCIYMRAVRLVSTQIVLMIYISLQIIGCLRILAAPQSLMADTAIATFTPYHFALGWLYLLWRVPATVPIVLGEALMTGLMWVSVYSHYLFDSPTDSFLNPAPRSLKVGAIVGVMIGTQVTCGVAWVGVCCAVFVCLWFAWICVRGKWLRALGRGVCG
jgi:hypothetical protein